MKKKLLALLFLILFMIFTIIGGTSCAAKEKSMFIDVEYTSTYTIVYNKYTKVMYAISDGNYNRGTFTLLVNADGTPMIWSEEYE